MPHQLAENPAMIEMRERAGITNRSPRLHSIPLVEGLLHAPFVRRFCERYYTERGVVASEPVQRALDRMRDAEQRGGLDKMIRDTANRVKAMSDKGKLAAMEKAAEIWIVSDEKGMTMDQVRALRKVAQDAKGKAHGAEPSEAVAPRATEASATHCSQVMDAIEDADALAHEYRANPSVSKVVKLMISTLENEVRRTCGDAVVSSRRRTGTAITEDVNVQRLERVADAMVDDAKEFKSALDKYKRDPGRMKLQLDNVEYAATQMLTHAHLALRTLGKA